MKRLLTLLFSLSLLLSLVSCAKEEIAAPRTAVGGIHTESGDRYPTSFLSLNGNEIEFDEFRYYYLNLRDKYLSENKNFFENEEAEAALKKEALETLKTAWGARILAEKHKVKLNKKEKESVQEDIESTIEFYNGSEEFKKQLDASYMTEDLYQYMMEYSALYLKLFNTLYEKGGDFAWSNKEYYAYYEKNYIAVQQIFIPYKNGEDSKNHPETLEKANSVYEKATAGEDFWSLIELYGEDQNMLSYPDGYYFTEGQAEEVLYKASKELEIDGISAPVAGETGLYIIKRMELKKGRMNEYRETTLFGYTDSYNEFHAGAYDLDFQEKFQKVAESLKVETGADWDLISTKTVF